MADALLDQIAWLILHSTVSFSSIWMSKRLPTSKRFALVVATSTSKRATPRIAWLDLPLFHRTAPNSDRRGANPVASSRGTPSSVCSHAS
jgi:hypothetical protein